MLHSYFDKLKNNTFFKNVLIIASGTAAGQAIAMVSAPIVTRIYTPEDYGIFTTFMAILGVTGSIATLRFAVAIPVAENDKLANNVLKLSFLVTLSLTLIISLVIITGGDLLLNLFSATQLSSFLWLIPVAFLGTGIYTALNFWALRKKHFKIITRTKIYQGVSGAGFKIGLGWLGLRPIGLLIGLLAQQVTGIGSLLLKLLKEEPAFFKHFKKGELLFAAKRFKDFPLYQTWSQLLLSLGSQLPVFFIAAYFGTEIVGLFGLAYVMVSIPINLLATTVSQVYFAEIAQYGKNRPDKILQLSKSIVKKLFIIGLFPVLIIVAFGPFIFSVVFGKEWIEAGIFARMISIPTIFSISAATLSSSFNVLEMQKTQLALNLLRIIIIGAVFLVSNIYLQSVYSTILYYSLTMTIYFIFLIAIIIYTLKRSINK